MNQMNPNRRRGARRAVCTVSAAALMLGVSQAATVGLHFQANYCSAASYTGAIVTSTAFGIPPSGWEYLTPMDTGYGCDPGPFTLNEVIDTTTSTNGLNPLVRGSLNVTWTAYVANVSGFAGNDTPFGGNGYHPGDQQVYWGFLRDGVNFGPGANNGDNNQPGYSVDITGLKSLFPSNPFVVQVIAASDSAFSMTNVFIIDATAGTTQSVVYANFAPINDMHNALMPRGIGGGITTGSGPVDTDHLQIVGNRAAHDTDYNNASTISGFILTDKPVVSMPPKSVVACAGDSVTLRAVAIGVPPVTYQWRKDGQPILGATNLTYEIPTITSLAPGGQYDLVANNTYGSATSKVAVVTVDRIATRAGPSVVKDSKPSGTEHDAGGYGIGWAASSQDAKGTNRTGVATFVSSDPDQIIIDTSSTDFDSAQGTISFWMRSSGTVTNAGTGSGGAILFDRFNGSGLRIVQQDDGTVLLKSSDGGAGAASTTSASDNLWHQVVAVFDGSDSGEIDLYIDGAIAGSQANAKAWSWPTSQEIELGLSHDASWRAYNGTLDDFRFYNRVFSSDEVAQLNKNDALVDSTALEIRLNFDAIPIAGLTLSWQGNNTFLQSAGVVTGPYADETVGTSPHVLGPLVGNKFFRYRHDAAAVVTNPYDE